MRKIVFLILFLLVVLQSHTGFCNSRAKVIIVANKSSTIGALGVHHPAVTSVVQRVASFFVDQNIGVFDEDATNDVYNEIERSTKIDIDVPDNELIALALKKKAEILVKVEVFSIIGDKSSKDISARVMAKMFKVNTGRFLAMSEQYGSNRIANPNNPDSALIAAASRAGGRTGKRLYKKLENKPKILSRLLREEGIPGYMFLFTGFNEDENDTILEIIYDESGLKEDDIKELKVTSRYLELEIFTEKKLSRVTRKLKKLLRQKQLDLKEQSRDSDKVIFVKKGSSQAMGEVVIE